MLGKMDTPVQLHHKTDFALTGTLAFIQRGKCGDTDGSRVEVKPRASA